MFCLLGVAPTWQIVFLDFSRDRQSDSLCIVPDAHRQPLRGAGLRRLRWCLHRGVSDLALGDGRNTPRSLGSARSYDPLDLIEGDLVGSTIVELGGPRRRMGRHRGGCLQLAAIDQIGGDTGCPKGVVADLGRNPGLGRTAPHHRPGIDALQPPVGQVLKVTEPKCSPFRHRVWQDV